MLHRLDGALCDIRPVLDINARQVNPIDVLHSEESHCAFGEFGFKKKMHFWDVQFATIHKVTRVHLVFGFLSPYA
jgi:hypothetical protein